MATEDKNKSFRIKDGEMEATNKQIRGSSLLLFGKFVSVGINLIAQVLMVRYLSKGDYGSWGYALAIVTFFQTFATFGLNRSMTRFIPIYHEKEEYDKLFGTIVLVFFTIFISGLVIISAVFISPELITRLISGQAKPVTLLFILIFLVPVQATDGALMGLFASFASPRSIFFRKFVISPVLKVSVVLLLIYFESNVYFLAYGYLAASAIGVIIYIWIFFRLINKQGIFKHFRLATTNIPAKEIFAFAIPLLTSDILAMLMHTTSTLFLGYFHGTSAVAAYQVILPATRLNKMVMTSFAFLYTPIAARFFAKGDYPGIANLYWQTAVWMAVLSFPLFALTFSLGKPLTVLLYGMRYEQSWVYLILLSFGYYFNVILGFNRMTLMVIGKVRYIMIVNISVACLNVLGNLLLIPRFGALGAAITTAGSMVIHNILKQIGLRLFAGISTFGRQYFSYFAIIFLSAIGLFLIPYFTSVNIFILFILATIVSFLVLKMSQKRLRIEETFPELLKIPVLRYILNLNKTTS